LIYQDKLWLKKWEDHCLTNTVRQGNWKSEVHPTVLQTSL